MTYFLKTNDLLVQSIITGSFKTSIKEDIIIIYNCDELLLNELLETLRLEYSFSIKILESNHLNHHFDIIKALFKQDLTYFDDSNYLYHALVFNIYDENLNVFKEKISNLKEDDLHTIKKYLQANANIVQAAKALYIHRNTLMYRLNRLSIYFGFVITSNTSKYLLHYLLYQLEI
ncbi:MAG: helix-turn-helix domain-containing protein [Bacilli bacterium]